MMILEDKSRLEMDVILVPRHKQSELVGIHSDPEYVAEGSDLEISDEGERCQHLHEALSSANNMLASKET